MPYVRARNYPVDLSELVKEEAWLLFIARERELQRQGLNELEGMIFRLDYNATSI